MKKNLSVLLFLFILMFSSIGCEREKEEKWYVAKCLDNSVASQGKTIEEALENLKEALELYLQSEEAEKPKEMLITTLEVVV